MHVGEFFVGGFSSNPAIHGESFDDDIVQVDT
jgi:hypothetical protein